MTDRHAVSMLPRTPDEVLTTTRAVRFRLDFDRPVEPEVIRECVEVACQAPTGRNRQRWRFVVVTDVERRARLADLCRGSGLHGQPPVPAEDSERAWRNPEGMQRVLSGSAYLMANLHRVPALLVPSISGRTDGAPIVEQAGTWGSILPAAWSFMLAARARGLGSAWTTPSALFDREALELLELPATFMPAALIPVAYTVGTEFKPARRVPVDEVLQWM